MEHADPIYFGFNQPELTEDYRLVTFRVGETELLTLDNMISRWSDVRDHLAAYVVDANDGHYGTVVPNTAALHSMFRKYSQTALFSELGILSSKDYSIGMVLRPVVGGVLSNYAIPVTIPKSKYPDIRYTTFGYESWGQAHDFLIQGMSANPVEYPKQLIPDTFPYPVTIRSITLLDMDEKFTGQINDLMISTLRKYVTTPGPHAYNMPVLQATLFDSDLSIEVYKRYAMYHNDNLIGYFVGEVTDSFFTVTHCIVNSEKLSLLKFSLRDAVCMVLRYMMRESTDLRLKVLHRSALINKYLVKQHG